MQFAATLLAAVSMAFVASAAPLQARGPTHTGDATYYMQGGNPGSCGQYHSDSDYIVAKPGWLHQDSNCGDKIQVTRGSKSITATIADTCPGCEGYHIDLSQGAFTALATEDEGQVQVSWHKL